MVLYEIKDLNFTYPDRENKALNNITLKVNDGEFVAICGKSGCGKSTLLRHLKPAITPHGESSGEILFLGNNLNDIGLREQASDIGYVLQNPDNQIVTDKVWHELAFGLESLGMDKTTIRLRVAEMASFFGISEWFMKNVSELSGGQKQMLNLASIMAMQPRVLILDEPTSQLDPIAATEFLETVAKINRELGTTVIITEHRLEEVFPLSDRAIVMENGSVIADNTPKEVGKLLKSSHNDMFVAMPSAMKIYSEIETELPCPITVRDGRTFLSDLIGDKHVESSIINNDVIKSDVVISLRDVWFKYEKNGNDIIKDLSLEVKKSTLHAIVGGNGTGKSTTLSLINRINKPYRGIVAINGKKVEKYSDKELFMENLGVLPQNPQSLFVKKTVRLDLLEMLNETKLNNNEKKEKIDVISDLVEIGELLDNHPYDLSGGEQQRAALAKVLLLNPKILLLDEPTKGLDSCFKQKLADILKKLIKNGVTILMVSHDIEFCAKYADVCSMFFDGNVVTTNMAKAFFSGNSFYTTAANRMSRHIFHGAVTDEEVVSLCLKTIKS
ncbi:MAG: energy-coupling factor transporter ATPase [Oscillospiraceae bacterium]